MLALRVLRAAPVRSAARSRVAAVPSRTPGRARIDSLGEQIRSASSRASSVSESLAWLEDSRSWRTRTFLGREELRLDAFRRRNRDLIESLRSELRSLIDETPMPPEICGDYAYSVVAGARESDLGRLVRDRVRRRPATTGGGVAEPGPAESSHAACESASEPEIVEGTREVVLDLARRAQGAHYFLLGQVVSEPSGRWIVYLIDSTGTERYDAFVRDMASGREIECIPNVTFVAFGPDRETLLYTRADDGGRVPRSAWLHRIGRDARDDVCLFREDDPAFVVHVASTRDGEFAVVQSVSKTTNEVYLVGPGSTELVPVRRRRRGVLEYVDHRRGFVYSATNRDGCSNFKVLRAPVARAASDDDAWVEVVPHRDDAVLHQCEVLERHLVLHESDAAGRPVLRVFDFTDSPLPAPAAAADVAAVRDASAPGSCAIVRASRVLPLPPGVASLRLGLHLDPGTPTLRCVVSSPVLPPAVCEYDLAHARLRSTRAARGSGGDAARAPPPIDAAEFECRRVMVPSPGAHRPDQVPLTIAHRRGLARDGSHPLLLRVYGAYGANLEAEWDDDLVPLLRRGWVLAYAHVRGGGERGGSWYRDGSGLQKRNGIADLEACARALVADGYTSPERLCGVASSAGGLVLGAAANAAPELFRALLFQQPFLDMRRSMGDPTQPLTAHEADEWGDPRDPLVDAYQRSYDPIENVRSGAHYPAMMLVAARDDYRAPPHDACKFLHRVRALAPATNASESLLHIEDGTHVATGGIFARVDRVALELAFLIRAAATSRHE